MQFIISVSFPLQSVPYGHVIMVLFLSLVPIPHVTEHAVQAFHESQEQSTVWKMGIKLSNKFLDDESDVLFNLPWVDVGSNVTSFEVVSKDGAKWMGHLTQTMAIFNWRKIQLNTLPMSYG